MLKTDRKTHKKSFMKNNIIIIIRVFLTKIVIDDLKYVF